MKTMVTSADRFHLRYHQVNNGDDTLLFIPGLGGTASWDYLPLVADEAYPSVRTLLPDLLGTGYSHKPLDYSYTPTAYAEQLNALLQIEGIGKIHIVAHSIGCLTALMLVQQYQGPIEQLILCEPGPTPFGEELLKTISAKSEAEFAAQGYASFIEHVENTISPIWAGSLRYCLPQYIYRLSKAVLNMDYSALYSSLPMLPARRRTAIYSSQTPPSPSLFDNIIVLENESHFPAYDCPSLLAEALAQAIGFD